MFADDDELEEKQDITEDDGLLEEDGALTDDAEDEDEDDVLAGDDEEEADEASLDELLAERSSTRRGTEDAEDEDEDIMALVPEPELPALDEVLPVRVIPLKDQEEFVCANCHLVKKKVQLVDAKRRLCRDCA